MDRMKRLGPAMAILAFLALFFTANRGAYQSAFSDDDLDNIAWTRRAPALDFATGLLSPRYFPNHFRPVGHFTFSVLAKTAGLRFRPYVTVIHFLHLVNTALLWLLLRRLGLPGWHAAAGALFFSFNMALFDAVWKPMYLFDLWCALFCLATLILYIDGRIFLALLTFLLAYKSKEHAVAIPAVLLAYEWTLGKVDWKKIAPFAAISMWFTSQGILLNKDAGQDYSLHFTPAALYTTASFYGPRVFTIPVVLLLPWVRTRRVLFGLATTLLLVGPMLFLPTRLSGAYLYVAMLGLAISVGSALAALPWAASALFFAAWIPMNYQTMREERRAALTTAYENRAYMTAVAELSKQAPGLHRFIYDGHPPGMRWWGIWGALRIFYDRMDVELFPVEEKDPKELFEQGDVALLRWDNTLRRLSIAKRAPGEPPESFIRMNDSTPVWQLGEGWYQSEGKFRWIKPRATARLHRPTDAREFAVEVNIGPKYIADVKRTKLTVLLDGQRLGVVEFDSPGWATVRFPVTGAPKGDGAAQIEFLAEPAYGPSKLDSRVLGIPIGSFGFQKTTP